MDKELKILLDIEDPDTEKELVDFLDSFVVLPAKRKASTKNVLEHVRRITSMETAKRMFVHKTANGREMDIEDMDDNHLKNTIMMFLNAGYTEKSASILKPTASSNDKVRIYALLQPYIVEYAIRHLAIDPVIKSVLEFKNGK